MATWEQVAQLTLGLPETAEREGQWRVKDKMFAWERPLRKADIAEFERTGRPLPEGPILAVRVPDEGAKEALIASEPTIYFTTAHFNGYPVVLVHLDRIEPPELKELLVEAWLRRAPKRLAKEFLASMES